MPVRGWGVATSDVRQPGRETEELNKVAHAGVAGSASKRAVLHGGLAPRNFYHSSNDWIVVALVVMAIHAGLLYLWLAAPAVERLPAGRMAVQVSIQADVAQAAARPRPAKATPAPQQTSEPRHEPQPVLDDPPAAAPALNNDAPPTPDVEPDYQAAYLNNPLPQYPMVARRMGLQGKVVLNVEVLESGRCGEVSVAQSSGHEVLDNAALQTVKSWSFAPARQGGRAVTKWFKVPIVFSLRDAKNG